MDPNVGTPHGKQSMFRWDASTATVLIVAGAFLFLALVHVSFGGHAAVRAGR